MDKVIRASTAGIGEFGLLGVHGPGASVATPYLSIHVVMFLLFFPYTSGHCSHVPPYIFSYTSGHRSHVPYFSPYTSGHMCHVPHF